MATVFLISFLFFNINFLNNVKAAETGTYTSSTIDLGVAYNLTTISWSETTCTSCTVSVSVAANNDNATWSYQSYSASGSSLTANFPSAVRYVRYQVVLGSPDTTASPTVTDVTIGYSGIAQQATLTSSVFDSADYYTRIASISWNETGTTSAEKIKVQVAASADNSTWSSFMGPDGTSSTYWDSANADSGGCTGSGGTITCTTLPSTLTNTLGSQDSSTYTLSRYFKYKITLISAGGASVTPATISSITINYNDSEIPYFESNPFNSANTNSTYTTLSWTESSSSGTWSDVETSCTQNTGSGCAVKIQVSTSDDNSTWSSFVGPDNTTGTYFTNADASGSHSAQSIALSGSTFSNHQYLKYRIYLRSLDPTLYTPLVSDITFTYGTTQPSATMTSSWYDTGDPTAVFAYIAWTETGTSATDTVKFQVRTAPDSSGAPGTASGWCGYDGTCDGITYFDYTKNGVATAAGHPLKSGGDDQWIQYRFVITSGGGTPLVSNVSATYSVNARPEVQLVSDPSEASDGTMTISYKAADIDTNDAGAALSGGVVPLFEFYDGSTWTTIPDGELTVVDSGIYGGTDPTPAGGIPIGVDINTSATFSVSWDVAGSTVASAVSTDAGKIRVTVDDTEAANNTQTATSNAITIDSVAPTITVPATHLVGTSTSANLIVSSSDDHTYQLKISNSSNSINCSDAVVGTWVTPASTYTCTFGDEPYSVTLDAKDQYNNNASSVTISAPYTPQNPFFKDISNPTASEYREFLTWAVDPDADGDFSSYDVYRSTDGSTYSLLSSISAIATNYKIDPTSAPWLSSSTTYYYKVLAQDTNGNVSGYTSVFSDLPDGQGGTDNTAPTISSISTSGVDAAQATITWTTDELSDSTVNYSTDTSYASTASVASMVTSHSVTLTGLSPSTTYNVQLVSADPNSNSTTNDAATPGSLNIAGDFSFTTAGGTVISNVQSAPLDTTATITWDTTTDSDSTVVYTTDSAFSTGLNTETSATLTSADHSITLSSLSVNTKYYFKVQSNDGSNTATDNNGGSYYTFTTNADTTAPTISNVAASLASANSAVITWTTDENADSEVINLSGGTYTNPGKDSTLTTKHSILLTGLAATTTYTYNVRSYDRAGNFTVSAQYQFTTSEESIIIVQRNPADTVTPTSGGGVQIGVDDKAPVISHLVVKNITTSSATVTWDTDEPATSLVEFGETENYGFTSGSFTKTLNHSVDIKDLRAGRLYNFVIRSLDDAGNMSESANKVFNTLEADKTIEQKLDQLSNATSIEEINRLTSEIENVLNSISGKIQPPLVVGNKPTVEVGSTYAKISWKTNRLSGSVVAYSSAQEYNPEFPDEYASQVGDANEQVTDHEVTLLNLNPGTTYDFQLRNQALLGGVGKSPNFTFKTKEEGSIVDLQIKDVTTNSATFEWRTNLPSTTRMEYGLTSDYSDIKTDDAQNISHRVHLENLTAGTLYRFRVGGTDQNGNQFFSPNLTFTTDALPSLIDVKIDALTEKSLNVSWQTDALTDSTVYYTNTEDGKTSTLGEKDLVKNHLIQVQDLKEGVTYKLKVASTDENGNTIESSEYAFTTSRDVQAPLVSNVKTQSALFGKSKVQTIISWNTDEPALSRISYIEGLGGTDSQAKEFEVSRGLSKSHTAVFTNFKPGTVYKFKLINIDASGNVAESKDYTILTPQEESTVFDLIVQNFKDVFKWTDQIK